MTLEPVSAHDTLAAVGRDLVALAKQGSLPRVIGRDDDANALLQSLDKRDSVVLVGQDGVGRTSVIHAVAHLLATRPHTHLFELSTHGIMVGTRYLGDWQTKLQSLVDAATELDAILVITDLWNLSVAGKADNAPTPMLDQLRPMLQAKQMRLIGEVSPAQIDRMAATPAFSTLFQQQPVESVSAEVVHAVLTSAAADLDLSLSTEARDTLVHLTSRFLPARPQPGPALELLRRVHHYQEQKAGIGEHEEATVAFIERVFSIYAGLPRFVISRSTTKRAQDIRTWFEDRIIGQREAIDAVVQAITLFKAGLHDPSKPLGTFLFSGPTGVGKTELARALATFLFGGPGRLLRFDLGEFKDHHAFDRLMGDPNRPDEPALLVDAVRRQPFQVVLFDELDKAHPNVFDALLAVLDEGRLTSPRGETVDLRSTFVICTTNAGAERGNALGFGDPAQSSRHSRLLDALRSTFRPEFLNRFQHIVGFHPLTAEQVRSIARFDLSDILRREGITARNLVVEVDDAALDLVIQHGFDPRWGARGLKRELHRRIVLPIAMTLMEHQVTPGELLRVIDVDGHVRVRRLDTDASRHVRQEQAPIQIGGRAGNRADITQGLRTLQEDIESLGLASGEADIRAQHAALSSQREHPNFWDTPDTAAKQLRDLDDLTRVLDRIDRLRTRIADLATDLDRADTRAHLVGLARRIDQLREAMAQAFREVLYMGPDGAWEALIEVRPLGGHRRGRDVIVRMYLGWAASLDLDVQWIHDPRRDDECAMFAVRGPYAYGYLRLEAGVHRVRDGEDTCAARVRVGPWTDRIQPMAFVDHRALKAVGTFGGKVRSRLACQGGLVLQNGLTLSENRDLAVEIGAAWSDAPPSADLIVRRYDLQAPLVRDVLTGESSGRPDAIAPERFHELLCKRLDVAGQGPEAA